MLYCKNHLGFSLKNAYQLSDLIFSWSCHSQIESLQFSSILTLVRQQENDNITVFQTLHRDIC